MRCTEFDELVSSYLSGELDTTRHQEFDEHVAGCTACMSLLDQQRHADDLLRSSMAARSVRTATVQSLVRARMHATPWWCDIFQVRGLQVAVAAVLIAIATITFVHVRADRRAALLFETAAADHVEDVVQHVEKSGWSRDARAAERLAMEIIGDARPVSALAPAGYTLVRARTCRLEGKAEPWLHLIYARGAREVSLFVRSGRFAPASAGERALGDDPISRRVGDLEVVGFRRGLYGIVFVADLSRADALQVAGAAADRIS